MYIYIYIHTKFHKYIHGPHITVLFPDVFGTFQAANVFSEYYSTATTVATAVFPEAYAEGGTTDDRVLDAGPDVGGERSERRGRENGRGVGTTTEVQQKWEF